MLFKKLPFFFVSDITKFGYNEQFLEFRSEFVITELDCMPKSHEPPPPLTINNEKIEIVDEFKYLGSYMNSTDKDINTRIGLAWSAFEKLKSILKAPKLKTRLKMRIFNAACISILLYGCESWVLTEDDHNTYTKYPNTCA